MKAGPLFEKRLAEYLTNELGFLVERRVQGGARDRGDLIVPGWVHEAKCTRAIELGTSMNEAMREAANAQVDHWATVHNRRQHELRRSYVTTELHEHARLLRIEAWARLHGYDQ